MVCTEGQVEKQIKVCMMLGEKKPETLELKYSLEMVKVMITSVLFMRG